MRHSSLKFDSIVAQMRYKFKQILTPTKNFGFCLFSQVLETRNTKTHCCKDQQTAKKCRILAAVSLCLLPCHNKHEKLLTAAVQQDIGTSE